MTAKRSSLERLARDAVHRAKRRGDLVVPDACMGCCAVGVPLEAHHYDYNAPLDVEWLCRPCHRIADEEIWRGPVAAARIRRDGFPKTWLELTAHHLARWVEHRVIAEYAYKRGMSLPENKESEA